MNESRPNAGYVAAGLGATLLLLSLPGSAAWACSCVLESEEEMVERAALAVTATAIAAAPFDVWGRDPETPLPPARAVTIFEVQRVLEGLSVDRRIAVLHEIDPGACGIVFELGASYTLAFTMRHGDGPMPLRIGLCGVKAVDARAHRDGG